MYLDLISDEYKLRMEPRRTHIALLKVTAPAPEIVLLKPVDATSLSHTDPPTSTLFEPVREIASDESSSDDDSEDDSEPDYVTASDSESDESVNEDEQNEEARHQERQAREAERQRVLEAAGLIIKEDHRRPPPRPVRVRNRRRAPAVPEQSKLTPSPSPTKELPPLPSTDSPNPSFRLDDAYERYEAYRQSNLAMNRLSIASVESSTSTASQSLPTLTPTTSESGESRSHTSSFLHFFRSRTPGNDGGETPTKLVISGPILQGDQSLSPESDAAFGSVSGLWCCIPTSMSMSC